MPPVWPIRRDQSTRPNGSPHGEGGRGISHHNIPAHHPTSQQTLSGGPADRVWQEPDGPGASGRCSRCRFLSLIGDFCNGSARGGEGGGADRPGGPERSSAGDRVSCSLLRVGRMIEPPRLVTAAWLNGLSEKERAEFL